jgi:hypothetical protein
VAVARLAPHGTAFPHRNASWLLNTWEAPACDREEIGLRPAKLRGDRAARLRPRECLPAEPEHSAAQVALAEELGISRTPLREALRMLQSER